MATTQRLLAGFFALPLRSGTVALALVALALAELQALLAAGGTLA
jgi:hypothetical protein